MRPSRNMVRVDTFAFARGFLFARWIKYKANLYEIDVLVYKKAFYTSHSRRLCAKRKSKTAVTLEVRYHNFVRVEL